MPLNRRGTARYGPGIQSAPGRILHPAADRRDVRSSCGAVAASTRIFPKDAYSAFPSLASFVRESLATDAPQKFPTQSPNFPVGDTKRYSKAMYGELGNKLVSVPLDTRKA
jgi:hypothetical protein